jgi:spermidine synthase
MMRTKHVLFGLAGVLAASALAVAESKELYRKASPYSTLVVTEDERGLRTLSFDNDVRQSVVKVGDPDHLELPYARGMAVGLAFVEEPKRILIIGLGGGTIPGFLHKHYPKAQIDVVDIDPDVVAVAKRFFGFREDATMRAYAADGRRFIETARKPYDIIFLDAYGPDSIPYHLATRQFLEAVRRALAPKGIAVANVWSSSSNPLYDSMVRTYQDVFRELYIQDVRGVGNRILIALPWDGRLTRDDVAKRASRISSQKQFRFDMGEVVLFGFRRMADKDPDARVLLDKTTQKKPGTAGKQQ